jgi:hypothetical protein
VIQSASSKEGQLRKDEQLASSELTGRKRREATGWEESIIAIKSPTLNAAKIKRKLAV